MLKLSNIRLVYAFFVKGIKNFSIFWFGRSWKLTAIFSLTIIKNSANHFMPKAKCLWLCHLFLFYSKLLTCILLFPHRIRWLLYPTIFFLYFLYFFFPFLLMKLEKNILNLYSHLYFLYERYLNQKLSSSCLKVKLRK